MDIGLKSTVLKNNHIQILTFYLYPTEVVFIKLTATYAINM
jgi:hypothetical protein